MAQQVPNVMHSAGSTPIFVYDMPRSCSHLFARFFENSPEVSHLSQYYTLPFALGSERVYPQLSNTSVACEANAKYAEQVSQIPALPMTWEQSNQALRNEFGKARQNGKVFFAKEHAAHVLTPPALLHLLRNEPLLDQSNSIRLPHEFLVNQRAIILIRNPALVVPSYYRIQQHVFRQEIEDEGFVMWTSLRFSRYLHDHFHQQRGKRQDSGSRGSSQFPLVVDAADVVASTESLMTKLFGLLELDRNGLKFTWDKGGDVNLPQEPISSFQEIFPVFQRTLMGSTGVIKPSDPVADVDLDAETSKWKEEFGEDVATRLRRRVDEEMQHYLYLRNFKLEP